MKIPGIKNNTQYKASVCARCKEVFLGELKDGCFPIPDGWGYLDENHLCPECFVQFSKMKEHFLENLE